MRILAVDIGNTTAAVGFFEGGRCLEVVRVSSRADTGAVESELRILAARLASRHGAPTGSIISSVVPSLVDAARSALAEATGNEPLLLDHDTALPVRNGYGEPRRAGLDRLANAAGGVALGGAPVIVVDAGTAITIDVVSADAVFIGGAILPGPRLQSEALARGTAALPLVDWTRPSRAVGATTEENIRSGIVFGLAGAIDRLIELARTEAEADAPVILTGGAAPLFVGLCRHGTRYEPALTLTGLAAIHAFNVRTPPNPDEKK